MERVGIANFGTLTAERLDMEDLSVVPIYNLGTATLSKLRIENANTLPATYAGGVYADGSYELNVKGATVITDAIVRNTVSRRAALWNRNASITLNGCITLENNTPADTRGTITDNRSGDCNAVVIEPEIPSAIVVPPGNSGPNHPHNWNWEGCLRLGAIGLICRVMKEPGPTIEVWGITLKSRGYFILKIMQPQVDLVLPPRALVACAYGGRVAVRVWADRNVTVSMGPSPEGKTHHVTLAKHLNGKVIGTVDTYDGRPCDHPAPAPQSASWYVPWVVPQASRADGSIVHVVREGDTLWSIANAYGLPDLQAILEQNDLPGGGRWLTPGQEIIIRSSP